MLKVYPMGAEQAARVAEQIDGAEIGIRDFGANLPDGGCVIATTDEARAELDDQYSGHEESESDLVYPMTEEEAAERDEIGNLMPF